MGPTPESKQCRSCGTKWIGSASYCASCGEYRFAVDDTQEIDPKKMAAERLKARVKTRQRKELTVCITREQSLDL